MPKLLTAIVVLTMVTAACGRKQRPMTPVPIEDTPLTPSSALPKPIDEDERRAREAEEARRRGEAARNRATLEQMVFFDYDRSNLRDDAQSTLEAKLPILRANPQARLRIEGHADERGSVEYNLALSLRRAQSVRAYLTDFGISLNRMEIVGFGEERPLDFGTSEAAYARNRRVEFQILGDLAIANR